jgi:hypothetical protein
MSHFITIRTQLRERTALLQALEELKLPFQEGEGLSIAGDAGREKVDIVIATGAGSDIGLRFEISEYVVVADWYNIELGSTWRREEFLRRLRQKYALCVVRAQAREQNLVIEEEIDDHGEIVLILSERG